MLWLDYEVNASSEGTSPVNIYTINTRKRVVSSTQVEA